MDEVRRLRDNINTETNRRTYPFPFERSIADDFAPAPKKSDHRNN